MALRAVLAALALAVSLVAQAGSPDDPLAAGTKRVEDLETLGWNAMTADDWRKQAEALLAFATEQEAHADPRTHPDARSLLVRTWVQVGRASENCEATEPPFAIEVGGTPVLLGWYRAASLVHLDRALLSTIASPELHGATSYYAEKIAEGALEPAYGAPPKSAPDAESTATDGTGG